MINDFMENDGLKKVFFFGVSNEERDNIAYSNFVYSLCYYCLKTLESAFDVVGFNRHDMIPSDNVKDSVYQSLASYNMFIFLLDEMPLSYTDENGNHVFPVYNPNVWFELGLAAPQLKKPIILLSRWASNPFYASAVQTHIIPLALESNYFKPNIKMFNVGQVTESDKMKWYNFWKEQYENDDVELQNFIKRLIDKMEVAQNPFKSDIISSDLLNVLAPIGGGSIYTLLSNYVNSTIARFYSGEKRAFQELTDAVEQATESLKTTRFANRSIVSGLEQNNTYHMGFMNQLYKKSQLASINSERIICNNNYTKWNDIYQMLLNGGKVKIYVRKYEYSTNFELVIVDRRITFIHFYQLSTNGKKNDDGTENIQDHQVINSTLKLEGRDVAEHMSEVFDRLYQREPGVPSRTLLGTLTEEEERSFGEVRKENWIGNGVLQITSDSTQNSTKRRMEVIDLIVNSYKRWYPYMINKKDKVNMGIGVGLLVCDSSYITDLVSFIKSTPDFSEFLNETKKARDKVNVQLRINTAYRELSDQFALFLEALEKNNEIC